jgi:hypothetical protein
MVDVKSVAKKLRKMRSANLLMETILQLHTTVYIFAKNVTRNDMAKPFNALFDIPKNIKYSKNKNAEKIVGKRNLPENAVPVDQPCELDYHCPVCKYPQLTDGNYDERLAWSEYNGFIYCYVCNKDYPSALCMPDIDRAINIYLNCMEDMKDKKYE